MTTETWPRADITTEYDSTRRALGEYRRLQASMRAAGAVAAVTPARLAVIGVKSLRFPNAGPVRVLVADLPPETVYACRAWDVLEFEAEESEAAAHLEHLEERDLARSAVGAEAATKGAFE